jgi:Helix-turn-helix family
MAAAPHGSSGGEPGVARTPRDVDRDRSRSLARLCGTFHNITYYTPGIRRFADVGIPRYWHAYMAYRSAPLGPVPAPVVTAIFFNFAPRMVEEAIPAVWAQVTPAEALSLRDDIVDRALRDSFGDALDGRPVARAAELARRAIEDCDVVGRPLFAAHRALPWPDPPHLQLFWACTLWREQRGDGHNAALAAAGLDGVECHVLMAARGVGSGDVIRRIRGWSAEEWEAACARLEARGLIGAGGTATPAGLEYRAEVEASTDRLASEPRRRLGEDGCDELIALLDPLVAHLVARGDVAGRWPPDGRRPGVGR